MKAKQATRLAVDGGMLLLLLVIMGYSLTGGAVHEWMGAALTLLILGHLYLNKAWFTTLLKGKYRWRRIASVTVNLLLIVSLLIVLLASLPISSSLFPFVHLFADQVWPSELHIWAGSWLFVLSALHLGMQWPRVRPHLPRLLDQRPYSQILLVLIGLLGLRAVWERNLLSKLAMQASFDMSRFDPSWSDFLRDYISIFVLLSTLSYYVFTKRSKKAK